MISNKKTVISIDLKDPGSMPAHILGKLYASRSLFEDNKFLEQVLNYPEIEQIVQELNTHCTHRGIIGYHYTRAMPDEIISTGLKISCGEDRRKEFLDKYGYCFTLKQQQSIKERYKNYFSDSQSRVRDGRIWFNFTYMQLVEGGADRLLTYFGGENIYMPLTRDPAIAEILRGLGKPLIVACILDARKLITYSLNPWGKIWLSAYHTNINNEALQFDVDADFQEDVPPNKIFRIITPVKRINSFSWEVQENGETNIFGSY